MLCDYDAIDNPQIKYNWNEQNVYICQNSKVH